MPIENVTPNRGYQLPNATNDLVDDVARLIAALTGVDLDVANILAALLTKADNGHEHLIADITGLAAALAARQEIDQKGQANGYAGLGADGKVPAAQLPATLFGALAYQGTWNANTNSPTIPAANTANKGHYYKVSVAGTTTISGVNDWEVGDWIVSNGVTWDKIDNTDQVLSVAGLRGTITAGALITALGLKAAAFLDVGTAANTVAAGNDSRLSNARDWTASTVSQAEAEAGTATTERKWTAQRVAQAIAALSPPGFGIGQIWSDVSASRVKDTAYQNTTGKLIFVAIDGSRSSSSPRMTAQVSPDGSVWTNMNFSFGAGGTGSWGCAFFVVPPGNYYRAIGTGTEFVWVELR